MSPEQGWLAEIRDNVRLRVGLWCILGIAWIHGLLIAQEQLMPRQQQLAGIEQDIERLRPFEQQILWRDREAEIRRQLVALDTWRWEARSRNLAEAVFRDWVQQAAQGAGLTVRELAVQARDGRLPAGAGIVSARLVVDFARPALFKFIAAAGEHPRFVGVDRLVIRGMAGGPAAPRVEVDLRAVFSLGDGENGKP